MSNKKIFTIKPLSAGTRFDMYVSKQFTNVSRSVIQNHIKAGNILVNGHRARSSYMLKTNDAVTCAFDITTKEELKELSKFDFPLDIIFENSDLIVLNKPSGISVHTSENETEQTLVNALINYYPMISEAKASSENTKINRPGIVHRLDKYTSGAMIVAKNKETLHYLYGIIKNRQIKKCYVALCFGWPEIKSGKLLNYLGRKNSNRKLFTEVGVLNGKMAISNYEVLNYYKTQNNRNLSLVRFDIITGRTHQIRAQSLINGFPIIGDKYYYTKESQLLSRQLGAKRQMLHSQQITFTLNGESASKTFCAPIAKDIQAIISKYSPQ